MKIEFESIIKPDFGPIRQVYINESVNAFLLETEYGIQFIHKDGIVIIENISQQFKIIGNTFINEQVSFISKKGLHKIDIQELIKKTTNSFGIWGDIEYTAIFISELQFPFLQYYSGQIKSIEFSDRLILVDEQLGIISYNVLAEEVEFKLDFSRKHISTYFNPEQQNEIYWANIDKFEISEDEKYFYVLTAYEGKSLFVYRTLDYSLLYHEIGSYALSFGIFKDDIFILPSGYDFDADDKQPFKIINLLNGNVDFINDNKGIIQDFLFGSKFNNLLIAYCQLSNAEKYNYERNLFAININDIINTKALTTKEIAINPEINLEGDLLNDIFIQDNYIITLRWNNKIEVHSFYFKEEDNMGQLITSIFQTLEDYRQDENMPDVRITRERIRDWINQFQENQRVPILTELDNIFRKRYCSKDKVKDFLRQVIEVLKNDFGFPTPQAFLKNSDFLNIQPTGKSQDKMIKLFEELIQERYNLSLNDCGTESKKYTVYIDDILCTGLTLISDMKEWAEKEFSVGKKNKDAVADDSTTLVFAYVFIHNKNYRKKVAEMRHKISQEVSSKHKMYRLFDIKNKAEVNSKIDIILPLEDGQPKEVIEYQEAIAERVNQRAEERGWNQGPDEFYRPPGCPRTEDFFTSTDNRKLVENAFLAKGIEILNKANSQIPNIRALGYSLPSLKDFGFGALCFTWRNVPNNAPLVFWYSGGGFTPLFKVKRRNNPIVDFNIPNNPIVDIDDDLPW